jgi:hypothetical protein
MWENGKEKGFGGDGLAGDEEGFNGICVRRLLF